MHLLWKILSPMNERSSRKRPYAESAARNAGPILEILRHEFRHCTKLLEIGSGTGQHAVRIAAELDHLDWQTSDLDENHAGIRAWIADSRLPNVRAPLSLDVTVAELPEADYDAVFSANTAHIMSFDEVIEMFALVGTVLRPDGVFCLYGPFCRGGKFDTPSNAAFDANLRSRDPAMGIRDLEALDGLATEQGLQRIGLYAVPSNNLVAVWQKIAGISVRAASCSESSRGKMPLLRSKESNSQ
jgi:SAM-dependent methyltransferase